MNARRHAGRTARQHSATALILAAAMGGLVACDELLEVELPASLTDDALSDPAAAETQVFSAVTFFECAWSALTINAMGYEDVWERITGVSVATQYDPDAETGECDTSTTSTGWYESIQVSRSMAMDTYDRLTNTWTVDEVPQRERFLAITALYAAANMDVMGGLLCEVAVDAGPLMSPDQALSLGEEWIARALDHISNTGDFEIPFGITAPEGDGAGAEELAYALRARMRWARGNFPGALADAAMVPMGFTAVATREPGPKRRNKIFVSALDFPWAAMLDVNDWWQEPTPNPATDQPWPSPIPFTGYVELGVLPDGRAVHDDGIPIRTSVDAGAVADPRVPTVLKIISGPIPRHAAAKYQSEDADIPFLNWEETWLIRAEIEGGQAAIDLVNELRTSRGLPIVTYADPGNAEQIRYMVLEEKRRALWLEGGRWWATKIQNPDLLWFPRNEGLFPTQGYPLNGGVRVIMPDNEYELNPNLTLQDRASMCDPDVRPVLES